MLGFMVGTVCLVGLVGLAKGGGRGCHPHHAGWRHGDGWRHGGGWRHGEGPEGGPPRGRRSSGVARALGEVFKRRVGVDADQEDLVDHALSDLRDSLKELGAALRDDRAALVGAFAGETVDEAALAAVWAGQDEALAKARREVVSSFKQIHAVLDAEQRTRATDWLGQADPFGRWS